jgi:hypothetical protein
MAERKSPEPEPAWLLIAKCEASLVTLRGYLPELAPFAEDFGNRYERLRDVEFQLAELLEQVMQ